MGTDLVLLISKTTVNIHLLARRGQTPPTRSLDFRRMFRRRFRTFEPTGLHTWGSPSLTGSILGSFGRKRWFWKKFFDQLKKFFEASKNLLQRLVLQLLVEFATRTRNIDAAGDIAFPVLYAFHDARRLATLGAIRALGSVHHFLAISRLGDLGHYVLLVGICVGSGYLP